MSKKNETKPLKQLAVMPRCSSCKHWNNKQAELEYSKHYGICTCFKWKFTITDDADCLLLGTTKQKSLWV